MLDMIRALDVAIVRAVALARRADAWATENPGLAAREVNEAIQEMNPPLVACIHARHSLALEGLHHPESRSSMLVTVGLSLDLARLERRAGVLSTRLPASSENAPLDPCEEALSLLARLSIPPYPLLKLVADLLFDSAGREIVRMGGTPLLRSGRDASIPPPALSRLSLPLRRGGSPA